MSDSMCSCKDCLMFGGGDCHDPDSDYFHGSVPDVPCGLFEDMRQLSFFAEVRC